MTFGIKRRLANFYPKGKALNVGQVCEHLEEWKKKGRVTEEEGMIVIDGKKLGISTLLGAGLVTKELLVRNIRVSEKARAKIEAAEGEIQEDFNTEAGETHVDNPVPGEGD